ncbi:hypothetical protein NQ318_022165 [Aromia moschata]|uniref:Titin-like n=1 Tax=Aromia moschata TaxID=1265417 RepID=A0AAV8Z874_9CUCU|nr:hypothetical protein NQ318_022165 [Aromia moschata]
MESAMESAEGLLVENITERVETTCESYQSTTADGTIVEENRTVTYTTQEVITTVDQPMDTNSTVYQAIDEDEDTISEITETDPLDNIIENDPNINLQTVSTEQTPTINGNNVAGDVPETASDSQQTLAYQPEGVQEMESVQANEYMLEHQSENLYMPEQVRESSNVVSGQVYATEMISDDSQDNATFEQEQSTATETISEAEPALQRKEEREDVPADKSQPEDQGRRKPTGTLNIENSNTEPPIVDRSEIESENVENVAVQDGNSSNVKEEVTGLEKQPDIPIVQETEEAEQPEEQEQTVDPNVDLAEANVAIPNETQISESVTLQDYNASEGLEVSEIQEGEYTIVEGPSSLEMSTAQQGEEEGNSDGTLVLLQNYEEPEEEGEEEEEGLEQLEDQQELYIADLRSESGSRQSTTSTKSRRGRKPTYDIPMHVLGHDISKPVESVPNGRALPKPRLGVKVPYRNLTSQIVSKAEIEKEIMERARLRQEQAKARGEVMFARKLTQRLASRKIAPSPNPPKTKEPPVEAQTVDPLAIEEKEPEMAEQQQKINNDSDLLAILEGEGEEMPVLPKELPQPMQDEIDVKMLEREIALQQLQELPHQAPKQRVFRGRQAKLDAKAPQLVPQASSAAKAEPAPLKKSDSTQPPLSNKENASKHGKEAASTSVRKDQSRIDLPPSPRKSHQVEVEPQVKVNMVLKTYSRKRRTIELSEPFPESPIPKKPMLQESEAKNDKDSTPSDVYVTKSSRVIKKKVIWDPDEVPVQVAQTSKGTEKVAEKKPPAEKAAKDKSPEKKPSEKPAIKKPVNERASAISPAEKKYVKTDSPKNSKTPVKNKKSLSEVDRLLMDEGAVKMLYDLKNNDEIATRKKKDVYSVDRAQKEIKKKANEIKNDLQLNTSNESPKFLRKKESFPLIVTKTAVIPGLGERKMSKDSTRSSVHTPPGSPAYSFPHSQGSMLVRRRSSSSISSSDESRDDAGRAARKKSPSNAPKQKKMKKLEDANQEEDGDKEEQKEVPVESKTKQFKWFSAKKAGKHVTVDLKYVDERCYCTLDMLEELTAALKKFARDKDCNVVLLTSSSKAFCLGLDYASLVSDEEDVRRKNATELSGKVRDFLLCLLNYPKVLVAGIQGECVGLGVTMLPLFDIVIASDTAMFSTPYAGLGCVAEGGFLLSPPHLTNHGLAAELLFTTQKLTADEVFRRGLISRLCWPEKYNETLKNISVSISRGSKQPGGHEEAVAASSDAQHSGSYQLQSKLLVEHWTSAECQRNFSRLAEEQKEEEGEEARD